MALTQKQEQFCKEYLIDLNATQAAIRAGYSEDTAKSIGCENLTKPDIQDYIQVLMAARSERTEITADNVIKELWSIAKDDIKNYLSFRSIILKSEDPETGALQHEHKVDIQMKDSDEIETKNISEISIGKDGQFKFKLYCRDNALIQVGRHLGIFEKDNSQKQPTLSMRIGFEDSPDNQ